MTVILAFDTETTGLLNKKIPINSQNIEHQPYIVQLSWIVYDLKNNAILNIQDHIIKCKVDIPPESSNIHKITNDISKEKGIPISKALKLFEKDFKKTDLCVGHNLEFDKKMYIIEAIRNKKAKLFQTTYNTNTEYCTMLETTQYCNILKYQNTSSPFIKYPSLIELYYKLFKKIPVNLHNSMVDVYACLRCYLKYKHNIDVASNINLKLLFQQNLNYSDHEPHISHSCS